MGRRCRHLNPRNMGAIQSVDARFIQGLSNGSSVGTWADRCGLRDYSQSTPGLQPTYTANSINGQPSIRFDGGNDVLECASTSLGTSFSGFAVVKEDAGSYSFIWAARQNLGFTNVQTLTLDESTDRIYIFGDPTGGGAYEYRATSAASFTQWNLVSVASTGTAEADVKFRQSGTALTTTRTLSGPSASYYLGAMGALPFYSDYALWSAMNISAATIFSSGSISASMQKRMEHSLGYSFKLATS